MVATRRSTSGSTETPPPAPTPSYFTPVKPPAESEGDHQTPTTTTPTTATLTASEVPLEMTATLSKTEENIIQTPSGIVKVRPYRSSSNAQIKALLSFTPRVSSLDRHNVKSQVDEFRGFFVLFWLGLALLFIRTSIQSWQENRTPLSWNFGRLITRDVFVLAIVDLAMVLGEFLCVPFVKGLQYRWYRYHYVGLVIQHVFQTAYLGGAIWVGYHRQWYWVQAGFLVLHCLSNLMKMHSYMAHNGILSTVFFRLQDEKSHLEALLNSLPEGKEGILEEATARRATFATPSGTNTPIGTPGIGLPVTPGVTFPIADGSTAYEDPSRTRLTSNGHGGSSSATSSSLDPAADLRRRSILKHQKKTEGLPAPSSDLPQGTSLEPSHNTTPHAPQEPNVLSYSSNSKVALLARNIDAMEDELKSNGAEGTVWPQNVTYWNYADYIFLPTLVYQLEYPRTNTRRPLVVLEKIAATFGTFSLIYTITEHYIMPYTPKSGDSLLSSFFNLALPMMVNYLLIFYIIFECVCTGFAELTYFADREFYQDWWNSTSWDQFSRKWNKPVHTFLLRHVYASTMDGLQLSRTSATFVTFLLSALCHELVMAVVTKKIRPYLFLMQMVQLPMIALGKLPIMKRNKTIGNLTFWIGLMCGFPLLAVCYLVY